MSYQTWRKHGGIKDQGFNGTKKGTKTPIISIIRHPSVRRRMKSKGYGIKKEDCVKIRQYC